MLSSLAHGSSPASTRRSRSSSIVAVKENGRLVYTNFDEAPIPASLKSRHAEPGRHSHPAHIARVNGSTRATPSVAWHPERRDRVLQLLDSAAERYRVDPLLVRELAREESNFDNLCVSDKGALGVMQLMPDTARGLGVHNPFDAEQNIDGGTRYLRYLLRRYHGNVRLTLAAYNAGEGAVQRYGSVPPYPETIAYVRSITRRYHAASNGGSFVGPRPVRRSVVFTHRDSHGRLVFSDTLDKD
jgi:soluble lytic murein transglycosylase-like protein